MLGAQPRIIAERLGLEDEALVAFPGRSEGLVGILERTAAAMHQGTNAETRRIHTVSSYSGAGAAGTGKAR